MIEGKCTNLVESVPGLADVVESLGDGSRYTADGHPQTCLVLLIMTRARFRSFSLSVSAFALGFGFFFARVRCGIVIYLSWEC
jgi:hypothetical protein